MSLSPADIERRIEALRLVRVSSLIEGLRGEPDGEAVLDKLARGEIDDDEALRRLDALLYQPAIRLTHVGSGGSLAGERYLSYSVCQQQGGLVLHCGFRHCHRVTWTLSVTTDPCSGRS